MPAKRKKLTRNRKDNMERTSSVESSEAFARSLRWLAPPDARWQDARLWAAKTAQALDRIDDDIVEAVVYLRAKAACTTDTERLAVAKRWPAISEAYSLFKQGGLTKWELEARLITTESVEQIAARSGLDATIVAAYAQLFFSVEQEYRDQAEMLREKLFADFVPLHFCDGELGIFWTWIALTDGPATLDDYINRFYRSWDKHSPPTISAYLRPKAELPLVIQALIAEGLLRPCTKTMPAIFDFAMRIIEADRGDPQERQAKLDDLFQLTVTYTLAFLDGQPASKLQQLLDRPPQRLEGSGKQSIDPPVSLDAVKFIRSAGTMKLSFL